MQRSVKFKFGDVSTLYSSHYQLIQTE